MELSTIQIIGGVMVSILSLFGIGKLFELLMRRRWEKNDADAEKHKTTSDKQIDADVNAFDSIFQRLTIVETKLDEVQEQLMAQKVENAKLEGENVRLSKDNDRLEKEIDRQRMRIHDLAGDINGRDLRLAEMNAALKRRDGEVATLRSELNATKLEVHDLSRQLKQFKNEENV
jgi:septal ring factor EnvC (AmiA/AmiB activator)